MNALVCACLVSELLSPLPCECAEPPSAQAVRQPVAMPKGRVVNRVSYSGTVTKIGENTIWIETVEQQSREFPVIPELVNDKAPPGSRFIDDLYLLKDVQVGDRVGIVYADDGRVRVCYEITIYRRPGGRVPPGYAPGTEPVEARLRHHDRMNAYQDFETKGTPLPEKFRPRMVTPEPDTPKQ